MCTQLMFLEYKLRPKGVVITRKTHQTHSNVTVKLHRLIEIQSAECVEFLRNMYAEYFAFQISIYCII